jgi:hypothetical protein
LKPAEAHDAFDVAVTPHGRATHRPDDAKLILDEAEAAFIPRK